MSATLTPQTGSLASAPISSRAAAPRLRYFYNGNILTMNPAVPRSPHMLLAGDRIWHCDPEARPFGLDFRDSAFGSTRRQMAGEVEFVDLGGRTVIPGMVDSHVHFMWWAVELANADLREARSEEEAVEMLRRHVKEYGIAPGEWIIGAGWSHNLWDRPVLPTRDSLDAAFPDNPVFLGSKCRHLAWVNSAALAAGGVTVSTPDPAGGEIERTGEGPARRLTGILKENAADLVERAIGEPGEEALYRALKRGQELSHSLGITGMQTPESLHTWGFLQRAHGAGLLTMRINFWIREALESLEALQIRHGLGDDRLRVGAVKLFADGSLGGRTAQMYEPYEGEPDNRGIVVNDLETIIDVTRRANRIGLSMAIHAIGDEAVGNVLTAYEIAAAEMAGRPAGMAPPVRNRIEHLQVFSPRDLDRIRALKPIASMQPVHLCADMGPADRFWGARSRWAYACRTLADAGCLLAFGSDAPVEPISPFYGLYAAVTRLPLDGSGPEEGWHPEEKLTMEEALAGYTINPAVASGQEKDLGSLAPGKLADFVILDEDPTRVSPQTVRDMTPQATYSGGECVFATEEWRERTEG